jgi:CelD/BcsL family acetyltransferase involved in cellulose biosynthesis
MPQPNNRDEEAGGACASTVEGEVEGMLVIRGDDPRWARFVQSRADALPFHHPSWMKLMCTVYGFRGHVLALPRPDGAIVAGVPVVAIGHSFGRRRWVSLPLTDYCPPLMSPSADLRELVRELETVREASGVAAIEIRAPLPESQDARVDAVIHNLNLSSDSRAVFRRLRQTRPFGPSGRTT